VQPQIPNTAGKSASVDAMQAKQVQPMALPPPISSGQGSGPAPGPQITNHINVTNTGHANDMTAEHITDAVKNSWDLGGKR
jgi:hypothetical protein